MFDVLVHRWQDIRDLPLRRRQACLDRLLAGGASSLLHVKGFEGQGVWLFRQACLLELEGVVGKKLDSPYVAGDRSAWLKVKHNRATPAQRFTRPARRGWEEGC